MNFQHQHNSDSHDQLAQERIDLAAALRWTARMNLHEGVANHFSLAVSSDGKRFLMNPDRRHFSLVKASDLLLLDADDETTMSQPNSPDPTAWGLHGSMHRLCPQAVCVMHVHSPYATVLASLNDSYLPPIDQNALIFYERHIVDEEYGGLAFEDEGSRCAAMFKNPKVKVMIMGNHGLLVIGQTVAETFDRLYYFERAAANYVRALQTGKTLRLIPEDVARRTAEQLEQYDGNSAQMHFDDLKEILDRDEPDYKH